MRLSSSRTWNATLKKAFTMRGRRTKSRWRSYQRGHRNFAGADCGVRAGVVVPGNDGTPLPAVRIDDRLFHRAFGFQRFDSHPGAFRAAVDGTWTRQRNPFFAGDQYHDPTDHAAVIRGLLQSACATRKCWWWLCSLPGCWAHILFIKDGAHQLCSGRRPGLFHHRWCRLHPGASLEFTSAICRSGASAIICARIRISAGVFSVPGFSFSGAAPNRGIIFINLKPIAERKGDAAFSTGDHQSAAWTAIRHRAMRSWCRSCLRRSRAWAASAASHSSCSRLRHGQHRKTWKR